MLATILFGIYAVAVAIQCGYAMLYSGMFAILQRVFGKRSVSHSEAVEHYPVSVIICARNERENLAAFLPIVLSQRYTNGQGWKAYEVIVVNDNSTDDSAEVLHALTVHYENLRIIHLNEETERKFPGKKQPLYHGVAAARHRHLLFTDADCEPASEHWLEMMTAPLREGKSIVAGFGDYRIHPGVLNAFVRWETMHTWLQYSSYTRAGEPYMAVGRNLACNKSTFEAAQMHPVWGVVPSGDDDLLVSTQGDSVNTVVVDHPNSFTYTEAPTNWKDWKHQKGRHLSTGKYYSFRVKAFLSGYAISHTLTWLCFLLLLCTGEWEMPLVLMFLRCTLYWSLWLRMARKLKQKKLARWFLLCDIGWMIYNFAFSPYIAWKNKQQWKSS